MSVLATDDFTGTVDPLGGAWVAVTGEQTWKKAGGVAVPNNLLTDSVSRYSGVSWPVDQWAQVTCVVTGTDDATGPGLALRASASAQSYYKAIVCKAGANNVTVKKVIAGVFTLLAQMTVTWTDGDVLYAQVVGAAPGELIIKQNGAAVGTPIAGDAALADGDAGIAYSETCTAASIDDWSAGLVEDLPPADVPTAQRSSRISAQQRMS